MKVDRQQSAVRAPGYIVISSSPLFCDHLLVTLIQTAVTTTSLNLLEGRPFREERKMNKDSERRQYVMVIKKSDSEISLR